MADDVRSLSDELARDPRSLAFLPLAEALRRQGQVEHARKIVMRGLERHPHLADAHDLLARIYADGGDAEKAFDEWDMVRRLAPGHAGAAKGMGFICFNQGRLADAEQYLREALAGDPADDSIRSALDFVRSAATGEWRAPDALPQAAQAPPREEPVGAAERRGRDEPGFLFLDVLTEDDQTALLLDQDGLVLAGAYHTWDGRDVAEEIGAELSGVSDEATRATRHLGIGAWKSIVFEAEAATVAMAPTTDAGLLVLATGSATPLGRTRRLLEQCVVRARAWLEGAA